MKLVSGGAGKGARLGWNWNGKAAFLLKFLLGARSNMIEKKLKGWKLRCAFPLTVHKYDSTYEYELFIMTKNSCFIVTVLINHTEGVYFFIRESQNSIIRFKGKEWKSADVGKIFNIVEHSVFFFLFHVSQT